MVPVVHQFWQSMVSDCILTESRMTNPNKSGKMDWRARDVGCGNSWIDAYLCLRDFCLKHAIRPKYINVTKLYQLYINSNIYINTVNEPLVSNGPSTRKCSSVTGLLRPLPEWFGHQSQSHPIHSLLFGLRTPPCSGEGWKTTLRKCGT